MLSDNRLSVRAYQRPYARLRVDAATGEGRWLAVELLPGGAARAMEMPVDRAGVLPVPAPAQAARVWKASGGPLADSLVRRYGLCADGTGRRLTTRDGVVFSRPLTWGCGAGGEALQSET